MNQAAPKPRGQRKTVVGIVTSDKASKTRRVEISRLSKHPKYGKYLRRVTVCHAHDEKNESAKGDTVELMETRPLSKTKRWRVVRVVRKGTGKDEAIPQLPGVDIAQTGKEATV